MRLFLQSLGFARGDTMTVGLRSCWQQIKQHRAAIGATAIILLIIIALISTGYLFNWTGFSGYNKVTTTTEILPSPPKITRTEEYQPGKNLWEWMTLFIVPGVLALGAFILNQAQQDRADKAAQAEKQKDKEVAERQAELERESREDNQREAALQAYLDKMSELLLKERLGELETESKEPTSVEQKPEVKLEYEKVRKIARVRTLSVLRRLDPDRKASVLQFLYESDLINRGKCIIDLSGADLSGVNLSNAGLIGVDLSGANLSGATLKGTNLSNANLGYASINEAEVIQSRIVEVRQEAGMAGASESETEAAIKEASLPLSEADLTDTNLSDAFLRRADLSGVNLSGAFLGGATLSDATLSDANLSGANLKGATGITIEELENQTKLLLDATMPDGTIHH
jgi:uncharacterized protein YjbI with pentapeptide repeats